MSSTVSAMEEAESSETAAQLCSATASKRCPDFGDAPDDIHCCVSRVKPGSFFCCNEARKNEELGIVGGLDRQGQLVLGCVGAAFALALAVLLFCCLHSHACPLHRWRRRKRQMSAYGRDESMSSNRHSSRDSSTRGVAHSRSNPHYTPVAQTVPEHLQSPPKPFPEAPPPYRLASDYPSHPPGDIRLPASPAYGAPGPRSAQLNRLRRSRYPNAPPPPPLPDPDSENAVNAAVEASLPSQPSQS